jgi:hypothetical protein
VITPLAVKGLEPGKSNRETVTKAFGAPVKADCGRECEYNPQLDAKKIVVRFSGDTAKEIEVTLDRWVRRSVFEEAWKLPPPDDAGKHGGVWQEIYQDKGVVLIFRGPGSESGVKKIRYADPGALGREKWLGLAGKILLLGGALAGLAAGLVFMIRRSRGKAAALRPVCPGCGTTPRRENRFCTRCGQRIGKVA